MLESRIATKVLPVLLGVLAMSSCKSTDLSKSVKAYRSGDMEIAAVEIGKIDGKSKTDGVWIEMQRASILHSAGQVAESQAALALCQEKMDALLKEAGEQNIAVGGLAGAGAVMTDDRTCNYVGAIYEAQLVCALQAANSLLMSDLVAAQAAVSSLRNRVDEATTMKASAAKYIAEQREKNAEERKANEEKYGDQFKAYDSALSLVDADSALQSAYNSWADTSVGIGLYMAEIVQRESGRKGEFSEYLKRAATDAGAQKWNQSTYQALSKSMVAAVEQIDGAPVGGSTYVVAELGLAPQRVLNTERMNAMKEKGLDVQLPGLSDPSYGGTIVVESGGVEHKPIVLTDLALIKRNEFDVYYPDMEYRAVLGKVIKELVAAAGAAVALTSDSRDAQIIGALAFVAGKVASSAQGADLRSWDCLPHQFVVLALPTPADGSLKIKTDGAQQAVSVAPGVSNFVVVTSTQPAHLAIRSAPLRAVAVN